MESHLHVMFIFLFDDFSMNLLEDCITVMFVLGSVGLQCGIF